MGISQKTVKIIWGLAAGRCAYPSCQIELVIPESGGDPQSVVGEIAHIVSQQPGGPRSDSAIPEKGFDDPSNLLLLCPLHHKLVDDQPKTHTVEVLERFKRDHEQWVRESLPGTWSKEAELLQGPPLTPTGDAQTATKIDLLESEEDLVRGRCQVTTHPNDPAAWQALASTQYGLGLYSEALESLARAQDAGAAGNEFDRLRAAVLTEDGNRRGTRVGLLEAQEIFGRLTADSSEWVDHYNFGNVLKALNENDKARCAYEKALRHDGERAEIWVNLATVQHRLGLHSEELESFNRALELNPNKPEALAGKGTTLLVDHRDGPGAVKFLESALTAAPDYGSNWPHIWFWLAEAYRASGDSERALKVINEGLRRAPGDSCLQDLKAALLSELWRKDKSHSTEALAFYRILVKLAPYDYRRRGELLAIMEDTGDESGAWELLEETFSLMELELGSVRLKDLGTTLHACYHALGFLPDYATYRLRSPVEKYWDPNDSLVVELGSPQLPDRSSGAEHLLTAVGAIAFGTHFEILGRSAGPDCDLATLLRGYREAATVLLKSVPEFTIAVLEAEYGNGVHENGLPIFEVPRFVGDVMLREVSGLHGWTAARLGVPEGLIMQANDSTEVTDFYEAAINTALRTILLAVAEDSEE